MYKLFAFFVVAMLASNTMGFRIRRQAGSNVQVQSITESSTAPQQSTPSQAEIQQCLRNCPVTAEYNPVCGSNRVTYSNPGRLMCAQFCGENITMLRSSPCPAS